MSSKIYTVSGFTRAAFKSVVLTQGDFVPRDIFGCHHWGGTTGSLGLEARDDAKHPAMYGSAPTIKNCPS